MYADSVCIRMSAASATGLLCQPNLGGDCWLPSLCGALSVVLHALTAAQLFHDPSLAAGCVCSRRPLSGLFLARAAPVRYPSARPPASGARLTRPGLVARSVRGLLNPVPEQPGAQHRRLPLPQRHLPPQLHEVA
jgi:hypothetical protein